MRISRVLLSLFVFLVSACSGLVLQDQAVPPASPVSTPSVAAPSPTVPPTPDVSPTPAGPVTLTVWLPPEFDPAADSPAGQLLEERLDEFEKRRPGVKVEVRVKAVQGPGNMLDAMTAASAAAPLALPDLVALPRPLLETAALKGLLYPMEGMSEVLEAPDWYDYARQLAQVQNSIFGLPIAGDAMVLVYRPTVVSTPPANWGDALGLQVPLVFPAADTQALFALALYQASGGAMRDDQGRPSLEAERLAEVLTFYRDAEQAGVMSYAFTQYGLDEQVWESFTEYQSDMVVTWGSRYLAGLLADSAAAHLPTPDGRPFTWANGWVWGLASPQPGHQRAATELAHFLTETTFLAKWTEAAGYLPARSKVLEKWSNPSQQELIDELARSAALIPSADILTSLGPRIVEGSVEVLKEQMDPVTAAQKVVSGIAAP